MDWIGAVIREASLRPLGGGSWKGQWQWISLRQTAGSSLCHLDSQTCLISWWWPHLWHLTCPLAVSASSCLWSMRLWICDWSSSPQIFRQSAGILSAPEALLFFIWDVAFMTPCQSGEAARLDHVDCRRWIQGHSHQGQAHISRSWHQSACNVHLALELQNRSHALQLIRSLNLAWLNIYGSQSHQPF